ncbi:MAG: wax ester/triacylglycerol synthase domain-containing protein [Nocardioidaceae bacterium]
MPAIDRASPTDRAFLAMDIGQVPEQFGVILLFDGATGVDLGAVRRLVAERIPAVPRLRQRLVRVPFGCGGPVWVDDPGFDVRRHVREVCCRAPGDEQALLDTALAVVASRLPLSAPLWSAVLVTGLADDGQALVVVLHHVLADGVGGLAVLAGLVDPGGGTTDRDAVRPRPSSPALALDALQARLRAVRDTRRGWRLLRTSMTAGGGLRPPPAVACSLVRPTGPRRQAAVVRADLPALRTAAHRDGATTNDALLVAVGGALHRVLEGRGESVDTLAVAVPVSGRPADGRPAAGNMVSPMLVPVPVTGDVGRRLVQVAAAVRTHKAAATGPPPIALLGWLFRPLARLGGFRWYMNHQHRLHTLVSHVRGPADPVRFGGATVTSVTPIGVGESGNVTVSFEVLSYAGVVAITAVADPDRFPDLDTLTDGLRTELGLVTHQPGDRG